ncbi:hypothetical protein E2C01_055700 [Portunus trituberculatus]|uniref:Uncharacterized protein n=1 Tax=Portunus trituberculatus TaxID=210409 RepID=A0A5B7GVH3_PORTR|nr:hypothetical protein [Portunus trituberculatus]
MHERLKLRFGELEALRSEVVDFSVSRSAGGLYVVCDVVLDRLSSGVWQQERQERLQECGKLVVYLNYGEARAVTDDGLGMCGERGKWVNKLLILDVNQESKVGA